MIVRMRFSKLGKIRWTSQRDVARMWERALRRASLPVSYSEGFSPRPKLSFGLALPTGSESLAEYLDVSLSSEADPMSVAGRVGPFLPRGILVDAAAEPEKNWGSLQEEVTSCSWLMSVPGVSRAMLDDAVQRALDAPSLSSTRERKGREVTDDLRPSLLSMYLADETQENDDDVPGPKLVAELATRPRGVRPVELAQVLGVEIGLARRTCQWIERDGSKFEPLEVVNPPEWAAATERAS